LLLGPGEDGEGERIYIGEGDPVRPRLEDHYARKDFWTRAVFFVAGPGQLNKAHVQYLEARLVTLAMAAKRMPLENGNRPAEPTLSEADQADMDVFLQNMLGILPVLGIHAFELSVPSVQRNEYPRLYCQGRGVKAQGRDTTQGFVVEKDSNATLDETPSLRQHFASISEIRSALQENGVLASSGQNLIFTQDYAFSSPSSAAAVVLGRSSNGRTEWKDETGQTLKEIQEAQSQSSSASGAAEEVFETEATIEAAAENSDRIPFA